MFRRKLWRRELFNVPALSQRHDNQGLRLCGAGFPFQHTNDFGHEVLSLSFAQIPRLAGAAGPPPTPSLVSGRSSSLRCSTARGWGSHVPAASRAEDAPELYHREPWQ